uniref:Odorant binding protein 11 n=1 Tax=Xylotrechus quadripes TaxID=554073 RepID=A0A346HGN3_9CUCU|nr:odorant binding protein 11 [Xylotrechus quadripes]
MKVVLFFLCVAIFESMAHHLPEDEKLKLKQIHESCQADPATYADENKLKRLSEFIDDEQVGTHMLCMSIKEGLQDEDGDLDEDLIRSKVALVTHDQSKVDDYVKKCAIEADNPEKTAILLVLCFVNNNIHYYHQL